MVIDFLLKDDVIFVVVLCKSLESNICLLLLSPARHEIEGIFLGILFLPKEVFLSRVIWIRESMSSKE
jgi:hypothetical protein